MKTSRLVDANARVRSLLLANAAWSALWGVIAMAAPETLERLLRIRAADVFRLGAGLAVFAVGLGALAVTERTRRSVARTIATLDFLWVWTCSLLLVIFWRELPPSGRVIAIATSIPVGIFAALQWNAVARPFGRFARVMMVAGALLSAVPVAAALLHQGLVANDRRRFGVSGRFVEVDGRSLFIDCRGEGSPTVIFEPGAGNWSIHWKTVQDLVGTKTRACVYDRLGYGLSDMGRLPRTPAVLARELRVALNAAGEKPPFVLVGHSFGGLASRAFASTYPDTIAELVLFEAAHEEQWTRLPAEVRGFLETSLSQMRVAQALAPFGILRPLAGDLTRPKMSGDLQAAHEAGVSRGEFYRTFVAEATSSIDGSALRELRARPLPRSLPLRVITADRSFLAFKDVAPSLPFDRANEIWHGLQATFLRLSDNAEHTVIPDATHALNTEQPQIVATLLTSAALGRRILAHRPRSESGGLRSTLDFRSPQVAGAREKKN